jgi:hypothetical protein
MADMTVTSIRSLVVCSTMPPVCGVPALAGHGSILYAALGRRIAKITYSSDGR